MDSYTYWKRREENARKKHIRAEKQYKKIISSYYNNMMDQIQKEINNFYAQYASKEGITMAEAKRRVSQLDMDVYERKAAKYVKEKNFSDRANEEMRLYNATMKINRLEMLKANIGLELVAGHNELQKFFEQTLTERTLAEFERQAGILGATIQDNAKKAHSIVNASFKNATFSDRIWMHQDLLKAELSKLLQTGLIQGRNSTALARELRKQFGVKRADAERLMQTELARVQVDAQFQSMAENGYKEYEYIACGSSDVCDVCKALDGEHFKISEAQIGKNAPPMHPWCHCSVAAYMDQKEFEDWLDFLNKGGTTEEWNAVRKRHLSKKEKGALLKYISSLSYKINYKLRNNLMLTEDDKQFINDLDRALSKLPAYKDIVYRSIDSSMIKNIDEFNSQHQPGKIVTCNAYTSASTTVYDKSMDMQFIIVSKSGVDIRKWNPNEKEILFKRKCSFKVTKREGNTIWMVEE